MTIEDSAELLLQQPHVVRLETRPPNVEGKGEVTQRELVRNCLRMRPDRIIVGEVRGGEALDMLQAMTTGHDGSIATVHANTPRDAIQRLEMMVLMAGVDCRSRRSASRSRALDLVVHIGRLADGSRKMMKITEISGMEGDIVMLQDLFVARAPEGGSGLLAPLHTTGLRPGFLSKLGANGVELSPSAWLSAA